MDWKYWSIVCSAICGLAVIGVVGGVIRHDGGIIGSFALVAALYGAMAVGLYRIWMDSK